MKLNLHNVLNKLNKKQSESRKQLWDRRWQWDCLKNEAEEIFKEAIQQSKDSRFWENLYIDKSPGEFDFLWEGKKFKNLNMIALCLGSHPTDISFKEYSEGKFKSDNIVTEKGGALLISQLPNGGVTFHLYPSKSEFHNYDEQPKLIKIFRQPFDVNDVYIKKSIKHMLIYSNDTSYSRFYPYWKYMYEKVKQYRKEILFLFIGASISLMFTICYEIIKNSNKTGPNQRQAAQRHLNDNVYKEKPIMNNKWGNVYIQ